jgi:hypothetical protein
MILLLCLLFNEFIAVRLVTVGPRVTAPTEGRSFRYILRVVTMTTGVNPNIRAILDFMQKQNERHELALSNLQKLIHDLSQQRVRENELLGKSLAVFRVGTQSVSNVASTTGSEILTVPRSINTELT